MRIASVILTAAVLAQYPCRRGLVRDLAARESAPLDENGLVEVVIEPSLEIVTCHPGHSIIGQSPLVRPQNEVVARVGGCDGPSPLWDCLSCADRGAAAGTITAGEARPLSLPLPFVERPEWNVSPLVHAFLTALVALGVTFGVMFFAGYAAADAQSSSAAAVSYDR